MIVVTSADVQALLIAGTWWNVSGVAVDFAEYVTAPGTRHARGLHVTATIDGGPHNGDVLVLPIGRVDAVRVA